ncbi:MAG: hypothetical protein ACK5SI_15255, partial [Planctomycetia bacterium]
MPPKTDSGWPAAKLRRHGQPPQPRRADRGLGRPGKFADRRRRRIGQRRLRLGRSRRRIVEPAADTQFGDRGGRAREHLGDRVVDRQRGAVGRQREP